MATTQVQHPETMWIFDVDGVLTNPEQKKIIYPELITELIKRLQKKEPIAFNSGRSFSFLEKEILAPLTKEITNPELLHFLFVVGEYGGIWITTNNAVFEKHCNPSMDIPEILQQKIKQYIHEHYSNTIFFDTDKKTMISLELQKGTPVQAFQTIAPPICSFIKSLLTELHLLQQWTVDVTRICIDIKQSGFDKKRGISKILALLKQAQIEPDRFLSFGDSPSDYDMHSALQQTGKPSRFVFVGEPALLQGKNLHACEFTSRLCDAGTLEYLKTH